jgi:hypothetical protein
MSVAVALVARLLAAVARSPALAAAGRRASDAHGIG